MTLKEFLKRWKLSISGAAKELKIDRAHMSRIVSGKRRPGPDLALKIEVWTKGKVSRDELLFPKIYVKRTYH